MPFYMTCEFKYTERLIDWNWCYVQVRNLSLYIEMTPEVGEVVVTLQCVQTNAKRGFILLHLYRNTERWFLSLFWAPRECAWQKNNHYDNLFSSPGQTRPGVEPQPPTPGTSVAWKVNMTLISRHTKYLQRNLEHLNLLNLDVKLLSSLRVTPWK